MTCCAIDLETDTRGVRMRVAPPHAPMQFSRVLVRLDDVTRVRHAAADDDRLALLLATVNVEVYRRFLTRVYGFESPVESAVQMTPGLDDVLDPRSRTSMKLLKADLLALGVADPSALPRSASVFPFRGPAEALGWIYVVERNAMLHGVLRRHLEQRLCGTATAYLAGNERAVSARVRERGHALDAVAISDEIVDRIFTAAHAAFRAQRLWFADTMPLRARVA